jgi:hypothetical protein
VDPVIDFRLEPRDRLHDGRLLLIRLFLPPPKK